MSSSETTECQRVFVLEDHPGTRGQLLEAVRSEPRLAIAGEAATLAEASDWLSTSGDATVALVDIGLPDGNGIDFIRALAGLPSPPAVLVITAFGDEKVVVEAIEAGATGYLLKERDAAHITESILTVVEGGSPISPSIARHLLKRFREPVEEHKAEAVTLTQREEEVLRQVVKGFSYKEIAENLDLSVHTVTSHIQHIYRKLSVRSRGEAVFEAIQLGLVDIR